LRMNGDGYLDLAEDAVNHQRDSGYMIEMRMGQKNMTNTLYFLYRHLADPGTGIDQNIVVDQERRGMTVRTDAPVVPQDSNFHALFPRIPNNTKLKDVAPSRSASWRLNICR
jgi:hypothetical protein